MEKVFFIIIKEVSILVSGKKIRCMEKEYFITPTIKLLMMENGETINLKEKVHFITNKF